MLNLGGRPMIQCKRSKHLDGEELWPELSKPFGVHGSNALHVFLGCVDKLVVDNVVRGVTQAVQGAGGVQEARHACVQGNTKDIKPLTIISGSLAFCNQLVHLIVKRIVLMICKRSKPAIINKHGKWLSRAAILRESS